MPLPLELKEQEITKKKEPNKKLKVLNLNACYPIYDSENLKYSDIVKNVIDNFFK